MVTRWRRHICPRRSRRSPACTSLPPTANRPDQAHRGAQVSLVPQPAGQHDHAGSTVARTSFLFGVQCAHVLSWSISPRMSSLLRKKARSRSRRATTPTNCSPSITNNRRPWLEKAEDAPHSAGTPRRLPSAPVRSSPRPPSGRKPCAIARGSGAPRICGAGPVLVVLVFLPAQQISLGHHTEQGAVRVHSRYRADAVVDDQIDGVFEGCPRTHGMCIAFSRSSFADSFWD
jgi:hypothetical protein